MPARAKARITEAARAFEEVEPESLDLTIVIPCLNEAGTIGVVVEKGLRSIRRLGLRGEVVVSDNGSTDGSIEIAARLGARVVHAPARGYGNALRHGMRAARGRMLIMGDADDTYNFEEIDAFVRRMQDGAELVMGTRLPPGRIMPGANPWLNRHVGTPALTFVLNRLFGAGIHDTNCGMRGILREKFLALRLQSEGMEFASEMVIKATLHELAIDEVPVTLYPDRRDRQPHLRRWRDGWRHLEFMLLHAPDQLLFFPGLMALLLGLLLALPVSLGPQRVLGHLFDFHLLFYGGTLVLMGLQGILGAILVRDVVGGVIMRPNRLASAVARSFSFGKGLVAGGALFTLGLALEGLVVALWLRSGLGHLNEPRRAVLGMLLMAAGSEIAVLSFLHAVLKKHAKS
ncbi:MAG TPA: glycosyltransferase family 2 protein [Anaeromyxobacteraceae bacterium]|jgi:glycosyltransferase involved in cell wall biosynthesis|nr:glycosyltransferase family 2 protein [Anaeromyxobacteraceae bacterium]